MATQPVTGRLLLELSVLGRDGIHKAGGLAALAGQHGVAYNTLRKLVHEDGSLTTLGQTKIQHGGLT